MPAPAALPIAIVGGGPAGLMAAETLLAGGATVDLFDAMPSLGRKFLMAGKGGMNITHSEPMEAFRQRYGPRAADLTPYLHAFSPDDVRNWMQELGIDSFVGTSGRVFPLEMKAAPLLRNWLHRLRHSGLRIHARHRWLGWDDHAKLRFATPAGDRHVEASAVILALGGGSWSRLGSDGAWVPLLTARGIDVAPLHPANCGFDVGWSAFFAERFAGHPVKSIAATIPGLATPRRGEFIVTRNGVEGGLIYALSAPLRDALEAGKNATLQLDLLPDHDRDRVAAEIAHPRGSRSLSSHLQSRLGLKGVKSGLLREILEPAAFNDPRRLAAAIKALPLPLVAPRPLDEAISSAGGIRFEALDEHLMVRAHPGLFCAGEMLDWEAPTGGYLLTACLATGRAAGLGALHWLHRSP